MQPLPRDAFLSWSRATSQNANRIEHEERARNRQLADRAEVLTSLTRSSAFTNGELSACFTLVTEAAAKHIQDCTRVGIWLVSENKRILQSRDLYTAAQSGPEPLPFHHVASKASSAGIPALIYRFGIESAVSPSISSPRHLIQNCPPSFAIPKLESRETYALTSHCASTIGNWKSSVFLLLNDLVHTPPIDARRSELCSVAG